jgi:hypothetical protein
MIHGIQLNACGVAPHADNNPLYSEWDASKVMHEPDSNHGQPAATGSRAVAQFTDCDRGALHELLGRFGLELTEVPPAAPIPGSFWGDEEAGLLGRRLLARWDTPLHSILHEACHYICMDAGRRAGLDTDAGGDCDEENAVCYLQIVLAAQLPGSDRESMCRDMDAWGYTFRLGSARAWFERDAGDARQWLLEHGIIRADGSPAWRVRGHA